MSNFSELKIDLVLVFVPFKIIPNGMISPHYDYEEFKIELDSWFKPLGIKWEWIPITLLNFRDEILYAKELEKKSKLVVFNLCDGTETDFYPGLSIIRELKKNEIPFTGGDEQFYKLSTEKILTKNKLLEHSISTAPFIEILNPEKDIKRAEIAIGYPFILKPNISAGNFGIYLKSVVHNFHSAVEVAEDLIQEQINEYGENANSYFAERFIIGNEYTVLVVGNYKYPDDIIIYKPIQRIFDNSLPEQEKFLSFHRYWNHYDDEANISLEPFTTEITEYYTYQLVESSFEDKLIQHSKQAFCALEGTGYARIDIRYDSILEQFFILEVNSNCGLSNESSSSVGNILNLANKSISSLIEKNIVRGIYNTKINMKICVLQPSYENSDLDYKEYDPPRDLSHLIPEAIFQNVFLKKSTVYKQLKDLKKENFDIFVNLCQGYLDWDIPSIDVIFSLENLNLPYTGSPLHLYDPSKDLMKYISYSSGVSTPNFTLANNISELNLAVEQLTFPFFIKPSHAGDSLGIDNNSKIYTKDELKNQAIKLFKEFDALLIEEYIEGREFSVLVIANPEDVFSPIVLHPVEFVFPEGEFFKTYKLKTTEFHPNSNILCQDNSLAKQLQESAKQIFTEFEGLGYARMDFRVDKNNKIFFLEINFACSVFYNMGYYGTADYILMKDGYGHVNFLKQIIHEGLIRFQRKQKKYYIKKNGLAGYGIFANANISQGEIIFSGEMKAQRIVSKNFVDKNWKNPKQIRNFKQYAYPLGKNYFILWDENPINWSPQNHSCNPNTSFDGLNVIALKNLGKNTELTLDYSTFCSEEMEPFECQCGEKNCRKIITGSIQSI